MSAPTPLIAGNWKMNGLRASLLEVEKLASKLTAGPAPRCTFAICPPATLLNAMNRIAAPAGIVLGGQDCHPDPSGAHTGDVSAPMLADAGATPGDWPDDGHPRSGRYGTSSCSG